MATSNQEVRIYVSKIETETCEILVVSSNLSKKHFRPGGMQIPPKMQDEKFVEKIKDYMTQFFKSLISNLDDQSVKFNVQYFFNKEYSAEGQLLYHHGDNGHDKSTRYFHRMYWVDFKKPLTPKEIELFIKALRQIPILEK